MAFSLGKAVLGGNHSPNSLSDERKVRVGTQVLLDDELDRIRGRRLGLVTNHTGIICSESGVVTTTIELLADHPELDLVALFSPEHGIRGTTEGGKRVASSLASGERKLPIHSLYGAALKPTPAMLQGIDMLLFDIQDIGARYYTYVSTMAFVMRAAGEADIPFLVLDRPNPIGGEKVQGNVLDPDFSSFVGLYPVPMRHGMTTGELARLYRSAFGVQVDLDVVPMQGWNRSLRFDETGLPWVDPSPNIPNLESATHYPGTCLFEGTGLSMGRGTDRPFQQVGAPGLDADALARALHEYDFCDIFFEAVQFKPEHPGDGKFDGEQVSGIRLRPVGAEYDPTRVAVAMLIEARRMIGDGWLWRPIMDLLAGTDRLRLGIEAGAGLDDLTAGWDEAIDDFLQLRDPHLLY